MEEKSSSIIVKDLYKIFGKDTREALTLTKNGESRETINEKTGQLVALKKINFEVKTGEIFVIMGLSGCGKSTLLRCINRLHEPTEGSVIIEGQNINELNHKELIQLRRHVFGMVFQHFALFPHRTVLENVQFGLELQGTPEQERIKKSKDALLQVGLENWAEKTIDSLSGGMRQRVGLARALSVDPKILLMDEPFSALDPLIRVKMQEELLRLQNNIKMTTVFVTHDLNEAVRLGDRIAILNPQGELVQVDTPQNILLNPFDQYVKEFVKDVDRPSALRAETIMTPVTVKEQKDQKKVHYLDPLKETLHYLLKENKPVLVVNNKNEIVGEITNDTVADILNK